MSSIPSIPLPSIPHELEPLRKRGLEGLSSLPPPPPSPHSWLEPNSPVTTETDISDLKRQFDTYGFAVLRSFLSSPSCAQMRSEMNDILTVSWQPGSQDSPSAVFRTDSEQSKAQGSSDYFLDSANRVHFFAEKDAVNEDGSLKDGIEKAEALNKVGHGLHLLPNSTFRSYVEDTTGCGSIAKELGWTDPVVPQSMYIFKQPRIGGEVTSHQDSTFLHTEPKQSCLGMWLALNEATVENGCLWVRPGSHKEGLRRVFRRNPEYFEKEHEDEDGGNGNENENDNDNDNDNGNGNDNDNDNDEKTKDDAAPPTRPPQMIFVDCPPPSDQPPNSSTQSHQESSLRAKSWEGALPEGSWPPPCEGLFSAGFLPVECNVGDLLVFPGTLDHLSLPNYSPKPRHTFQLHLIEGPGGGVQWSKGNWLQYPEEESFVKVGVRRDIKD